MRVFESDDEEVQGGWGVSQAYSSFCCLSRCTEPNGDETVWRYFDLAKYVDLLARRKLFFSRVGLMEDKFEGTYTRRHLRSVNEIGRLIEYARHHKPSDFEGHTDDALRAIIKADTEATLETVRQIRDFSFISCWHRNDCESAGMWRLYSKSGEGVAIRTTYERLTASLESSVAESLFLAGNVEYLDYDTDVIEATDFFRPFMRKRRSFEHEREVRLACVDIASVLQRSQGGDSPLLAGFDCVACLDRLIDRVYVAPSAPVWFRNVVKDITAKYGVNAEVHRSDLDKAIHCRFVGIIKRDHVVNSLIQVVRQSVAVDPRAFP